MLINEEIPNEYLDYTRKPTHPDCLWRVLACIKGFANIIFVFDSYTLDYFAVHNHSNGWVFNQNLANVFHGLLCDIYLECFLFCCFYDIIMF